MKQIFHILKFKLISFLRLESKISVGNLIKNIGSGVIYIGFAIGAFYFSQSLIRFLLVEIKVGLFLLHEFISMILFIFFMSVNLGNVIVSYSTLYKSNEVNFLLTKPISPTKIFFIKFLDNFFYSSSTLLMVLFSLLAGYVFYFKLSVLAFFLMLCNFIPFMLSAGSLGVIILLILIRLIHSYGLKKIIFGLATAYLLSIALFFRTVSPRDLVNTVLRFYPHLDKDGYLSYLLPTSIKLLPNNWLSQSAYWLVRGDYQNSLALTFMQIVLSIVLVSIAIYLGKKWYFKTWLLNLKITADYHSSRKKVIPVFAFENESALKSQTESIIKRDFFLFMREPSQVIHLSVLLFLILVFISSASGIKFVGLGNFYLQTMIYLSLFLFNLLLITTLSLRFIFPMISLEGQVFWKLKSSPIDSSAIIKSKLSVLSITILIVSISLSFFVNYKFGAVITIFSIVTTFFAACTIISVNFGMGGMFANYREKNPIRLSSSQGATLSFLINIVYMLFLIVVLFSPLNELFLSIMLKKSFSFSIFFWSLIPIAVVSIILSSSFLMIASKSLNQDF